MLVSVHPPLLLAPAGIDSTTAVGLRRCLHAALWLSVAIDEWQVRLSGHVHLIREPDEMEWREVDLTRHPLRPAPGAPDAGSTGLEEDLRRSLAKVRLHLHRIPDLGLVSDIGEGRDDFRRRATGMLRPELHRRIAAIVGEPSTGAHPRQRAADRLVADEKARLASELATLIGSIETVELPELTAHVRRAEVGSLLVAAGVRLEAPRHRSLMI